MVFFQQLVKVARLVGSVNRPKAIYGGRNGGCLWLEVTADRTSVKIWRATLALRSSIAVHHGLIIF